MLDPRRYTDDRITVAVYTLHNGGKTVREIARASGMSSEEVRHRIASVWLEHKLRVGHGAF